MFTVLQPVRLSNAYPFPVISGYYENDNSFTLDLGFLFDIAQFLLCMSSIIQG